ncbi:hypothetical protein FHT21_002324 [Pedobacter sp. SG908]|nr:hypothetical protein [Pedobacter sp. SG908]NMN37149.1 hypothetical protein [Pedobacter sp. SG918]
MSKSIPAIIKKNQYFLYDDHPSFTENLSIIPRKKSKRGVRNLIKISKSINKNYKLNKNLKK